MVKKLLCLPAAVLGLLVFSAGAQAQTYSILDLGTLGGDRSYGNGINASGQVTGYSYTSNGLNPAYHAFRTTATGKISDGGTDLGTLGGASSAGYSINASGQITGNSQISGNSSSHAFRTTATGKVSDSGTDLGTLGGISSFGQGINASGQVTGYAYTATAQHAFRTTATGLISDSGTDLGTFSGGNASQGYGINDSGQVTGFSQISGGAQHAFRTTATGNLSDGTAIDMGTFGGTASYGLSINASGQVVGYSDTSFNLTQVAFIYTTSMVDLNTLLSPADQANWNLIQANSINDSSQITGYGTFMGNETHAFRMTLNAPSTPEPGVWGLLSALAMASLALHRRRK